MEQFFAQNPAIAYIIVIGLFSLCVWLIKLGVNDHLTKIQKNESDIKDVEKRTFELENNFNSEIQLVRKEANINHNELKDLLSDVKVELARIAGQNNQ